MHSVLAARHNGNNAEEGCGKNETRTEDVLPGQEKEVMVMGWGRWWAALVARRRARRWRVRLTFQTCRRCGSYAWLPVGLDPICGNCRSLR